jgi:hypothetical protein
MDSKMEHNEIFNTKIFLSLIVHPGSKKAGKPTVIDSKWTALKILRNFL